MKICRYPVNSTRTGQPIYWFVGQVQPRESTPDLPEHQAALALRHIQYANGQRIRQSGTTIVQRDKLEPWAA